MRRSILVLVLGGCGTDASFAPTPDDVEVESPRLGLSPAFVQYGELRRAEVVERAVTLSNDGGAVLDVESIAIEAPEGAGDFEIVAVPELPLALAAGAPRTLSVRFTPRAGGLREAELVVSADDGARVARVPLAGSGAVPVLEVVPGAIDIGERPIGCGTVRGLRLTSSGREAVQLAAVELVGGGAILGGVPELPAVLEPGRLVPLTVAHVPEVLGPWSAVVRIVSDGTPEPVEVPVTSVGLPREVVEEVFEDSGASLVDVLVMVDQSGSMGDQLSTLANAFSTLTAELEALAFSWRVGVYTGDATGCLTAVLDPSMPDWQGRFAAAVSPFVGPPVQPGGVDLTEAPIDGLRRVIDEAGPGGCNADFRREGAPIHVLDFSDEREQSSGWDSSPASYWLDDLDAFVAWAGGAELFVWHAIVDVDSTCGMEPFGPGGHVELAQATGGQVIDLCGPWRTELLDVAASVTPGRRRFVLATQDIVPSTIVVTVDGRPVGTPPTFDPATRAVILAEPAPAGSRVVVRFERIGACPP